MPLNRVFSPAKKKVRNKFKAKIQRKIKKRRTAPFGAVLRFMTLRIKRPLSEKPTPEVIVLQKNPQPTPPFPQRPIIEPHFGVPADCADLINKYGTYNIQPTADTENLFPLIAHALPAQWHDMALDKGALEAEQEP